MAFETSIRDAKSTDSFGTVLADGGAGDVSGITGKFAMARARHSIGGSHTVVTYPPLAVLGPGDTSALRESVQSEQPIHLYAHIAFCEFHCPFCHYETKVRKLRSHPDAALDAYMAALTREWSDWKSLLQGSSLASLYVGGGTPTSIPLPRLTELIRSLLDFPKEPGFGFCVETSPSSIVGPEGEDTLYSLAALGVNRFSMGAQTSNNQLLRRTRGHSRETLLRAVENLNRTNCSYNIDFIQDLPDQDDDELTEDIEFIRQVRPPQLSWYILRLEPQSAWRRRYDDGLIDLPGSDESIERRLRIIEEMRAMGYRVDPGGRFTRDDKPADSYKRVRSQLGEPLVGIGASAYSHAWGWFFRNVHSGNGVNGIKEYVARIERGESPIADVRRLTSLDQQVSRVLAAVRTIMPPISSLELESSYLSQVMQVVGWLREKSLISETVDGLVLTDLGRALEEEICVQFYPPDVRADCESQ